VNPACPESHGRFGSLLRQLRSRAGVSQEALAERARLGVRWLFVGLRALPIWPVGLTFSSTPLGALALALISGIGGGVVFLLSLTAWGRWLVFSRLRLPLTGRVPWHVQSFLDDAGERGALRRAGAVYQFRHARLQDHLAEA
jgi:hypothetical protein